MQSTAAGCTHSFLSPLLSALSSAAAQLAAHLSTAALLPMKELSRFLMSPTWRLSALWWSVTQGASRTQPPRQLEPGDVTDIMLHLREDGGRREI